MIYSLTCSLRLQSIFLFMANDNLKHQLDVTVGNVRLQYIVRAPQSKVPLPRILHHQQRLTRVGMTHKTVVVAWPRSQRLLQAHQCKISARKYSRPQNVHVSYIACVRACLLLPDDFKCTGYSSLRSHIKDTASCPISDGACGQPARPMAVRYRPSQ